MYHDVSHLLSRLINGPTPLRQIYFASTNSSTPELAYQVDFPRLEIVLEGEFADSGIDKGALPRRCLVCSGWRLEYSRSGSHRSRHSASCSANSNWVLASSNGTASNIKTLPTSTSLGVDRVLALFCCKRSMRCKCSRRSSKPPG